MKIVLRIPNEIVIINKINKQDNKTIEYFFFNINEKKESVDTAAMENVVIENKISSTLLKEFVIHLL
ncbi:hypothetical protein [Chryseobacterium hagamense]|uniref:Uncharacterized protein n=1 Tax=Chryseobacterium hagamense TaxID=395935 RepID=A0A511YNB0_9FLAO|nr:hypothetical protein [Chryseobacterium hagamense]GEN76688.1 hypothetical protein CHA01nite_24280 [Chryseobacterium hagamense]